MCLNRPSTCELFVVLLMFFGITAGCGGNSAVDTSNGERQEDTREIVKTFPTGETIFTFHDMVKSRAARYGCQPLGGTGASNVFYDFADYEVRCSVDGSGKVLSIIEQTETWPDSVILGRIPFANEK